MSTILAIDDKQDHLVVITALFKNWLPDVVVFTAQSGQEGLDIAERALPDVILLDIIMPGVDGYEVCRRLKAAETTRHIPMIMLTALDTDSQSRVKALELGADAFLSKPIDGAELVAQVKAMLRIKLAEDRLRHENESLELLVQRRTSALRSELEARRQMEEQIRASLKEKESLLQEIYHLEKMN